MPHVCFGHPNSRPTRQKRMVDKAVAVPDVEMQLVRKLENLLVASSSFGQDWPSKIKRPRSLRNAPGPWSDPKDETVWPNRTSRSNSDAWLVKNHGSIRRMQPRVLLINFSNEHDNVHLSTLTAKLIKESVGRIQPVPRNRQPTI